MSTVLEDFLLNLVRAVAMEKKLVANADLNPDRRLHASGGRRGRCMPSYAKPATRTKPKAGYWASSKVHPYRRHRGHRSWYRNRVMIRAKLEHLTELVNGWRLC